MVGSVLLVLARRVHRDEITQEAWIPLAFVGTLLLNPRIMKYDLAPITIPMLLIGWRGVRCALKRSSRHSLAPVLVGVACFLATNIVTITGPQWLPVELAVLLAIFTLGVWSLYHSSLEAQSPGASSELELSEELDVEFAGQSYTAVP
jgi:hypothetical protein